MKGWIRLRRYIKPKEQWSFTVNELNDRIRLFLHDWVATMLSGEMGFREDGPHKPVVITELASGTIQCSRIEEVASSKLPLQGMTLISRTLYMAPSDDPRTEKDDDSNAVSRS